MTARRIAVLSWTAAEVCMLLVLAVGQGASQNLAKQTHTYKVVGELDILADVYQPQAVGALRPIVVWMHGGALIAGHREAINEDLFRQLIDAGNVIVSIDYRLAPETLLPDIIADIEDAFSWVRQRGPTLFGGDPERLVAMGASAGGYLALVAGHRVQPAPEALVSFCGYGDLVGNWLSDPSTHARHNRRSITRAEALAQVGPAPISDSREREGDGDLLYFFLRQRGEWSEAVSGWSIESDRERFRPFMPLSSVTSGYPPTLLIHGTADTDVPYEQSFVMAQELESKGVEHRLITLPDAEHCLARTTEEQRQSVYGQVVRFVAASVALTGAK